MIYENASEWMGLPVKKYDFEAGADDYESCVYRFAVDWDSKHTTLQALEKFLDHPDVGKVPGIVIGLFAPESEGDPSDIVAALIAAKDKLKSLRGIFMGDIVGEEQEISWIENCDMGPLLEAFPNLEFFRVRGGNGLSFSYLQSLVLRSLVIETGGLEEAVTQSVLEADLPKLEHLELWLGTEDYGGTSNSQQISQLLTLNPFPHLNYLGLRNCDFADEVAKVVAMGPLPENLEILDLSLGTLGDEGGKALLESTVLGGLSKLDLHHHYMSDEVMAKFGSLGITVDVSDKEDVDTYGDEEYRYVAVGE